MSVVVLGYGRQGKIIADDLAQYYDVTVVDTNLSSDDMMHKNISFRAANLSNYDTIRGVVKNSDLVVCALPSKLGYNAVMAAIDVGVDCVDLSFCPEDLVTLNADALSKGVTVLHDCGVAPGLSNLVAGRAVERKRPHDLHIAVGGVTTDPASPLGYTITWSVDDLLEEYTRAARIVHRGKEIVVPALTGLENVSIPGVGVMEAFFTDGLRSLLDLKNAVPHLTEKTLRWPGHVDQIRHHLEPGHFQKFLHDTCVPQQDLLVLKIDADEETALLVIRGDDDVSAMSKGTAHSCGVFARTLLEYPNKWSGVIPPEYLAKDQEVYRFILDSLNTKFDIRFDSLYPFDGE